MQPENSDDLAPEVGAPTDIAPIGRHAPKPAHERTASEDHDTIDWAAIAAKKEFKALLRAKARFIIPMTIFFILYYFALPVLVGFFPELMKTKLIGEVNAAYLFALSQFIVAWAIAWAYTRVAARWDRIAADLIAPSVRDKRA